MAHLHETLETSLPIDDAFRFVADFANAATWDPGTAASERIDPGPVGVGARFRLGVRMAGRTAPMEYRIVAFEPPERVVLIGEGSSVSARDEIRFRPLPGGGTRIDYTADIRLGSWMRLLEPLAGGAFRRIGQQARDGMRRTLDERARIARSVA
jgi:carbon monoxide dehydrogenase subunit G